MKAKKADKVLAVLLYSDNQNAAENVFKILENHKFQTVLQKHFVLIGLLANGPDAHKLMKEYPPSSEIPCFLFMTDIIEKAFFIDFAPIKEDTGNFTEKLNQVVSNPILRRFGFRFSG